VYLRQSQDPDGRGTAIERQRLDCEKLVVNRGWHVVDVFVDNDTSATARNRPGFEAMMVAARAGAFDVIVAWHVDRIVRRLADLEPVLSSCEAAGTPIVTVTGDIDPSNDAGRLVARILSSVAQAEVERKGARERRAWRQQAEAGRVKIVRRPYGYTLDGRVVRREGNVIRRAAAEVLAGTSLNEVCRKLNADGIKTSTGRVWGPTTLKRVLRNPRYAGLATYHGDAIAPGRWTPILTLTTHQDLLATFADPVRHLKQDPVRKHLLSGILTCGRCGHPLRSSNGGPGRRVYRCPRCHLARRQDRVDETVVSAILVRLARQDVLCLLDEDDDDLGDAARTLRQRMLECRSRLNQAAEMFAGGTIDATQLERVSLRSREQLATLERDYAIVARQPALAAIAEAAGRAKPQRSLAAAWEHLDLRQQRDIVRTLLTVSLRPVGPGRHFSPDQVQISWRRHSPRGR
jgi:DNA invertase Pin-like site-specific DNA recombinase